MAFPFAAMPTLRDFITEAVCQGCVEAYAETEAIGARGATRPHYLLRGKLIVILPNQPDDTRLEPTLLASWVRVLKVTGYEHLVRHLTE